jgi:hypothetical protein
VALLFAFVPAVGAQDETPSVTVEDQAIENGQVTVTRVYSDGPGWIVIHADDAGSPGSVIGQTAVEDGENTDVVVEIDNEAATETLYAMLHEDTGTEGTYEFPDGDAPVSVDGEVVVASFTVTGGMMEEDMDEDAEMMATPSVTVNDQELEDGQVTVASVYSDGPGWMVIHADDNGSPGTVIGQAAVTDGENTDVIVDIDTDAATQTLYAMLHEDTGTEGTYEFPDGDAPVTVDDQVVVSAFTLTGPLQGEEQTDEAEDDEAADTEDEAMLPASGEALPWGWTALVIFGLLLMSLGLGLAYRRVRVRRE